MFEHAIRTYILVAGLIIGAAGAAAIGLLLVVPWAGGTKASDWLQIGGSLVGAALPVIAAVIIESQRRKKDLQRSRNFIVTTIVGAAAMIEEAPRPLMPESLNLNVEDWATEAIDIELKLLGAASRRVADARSAITPLDDLAIQCVRTVEAAIRFRETLLLSVRKPGAQYTIGGTNRLLLARDELIKDLRRATIEIVPRH